MAARRFYLVGAGAPAISPTPDAGWEQTGQLTRLVLTPKLSLDVIRALTNTSAITVPITTTQDILCAQFISAPLRSQVISGTMSLVITGFENANTNNVTLAVVLRVLSQDGGTVRGTLFSNFNQDTEFNNGTQSTRIVNAQALTQTTILDEDRLVLEIGGHAAGPTAAGSYTMRFGTSAASDFALTSALTTDLNSWFEMSNDPFLPMPNNYQGIGSVGLSTNRSIR